LATWSGTVPSPAWMPLCPPGMLLLPALVASAWPRLEEPVAPRPRQSPAPPASTSTGPCPVLPRPPAASAIALALPTSCSRCSISCRGAAATPVPPRAAPAAGEGPSPSSSAPRCRPCCPEMINGCSGFLIVDVIGVVLPGSVGQGWVWLLGVPPATPPQQPPTLGEQGFPHLDLQTFKGWGNEAQSPREPIAFSSSAAALAWPCPRQAPLVGSAAPRAPCPGVFHAQVQPCAVPEAVPGGAAPQQHPLHLQPGLVMPVAAPVHSLTPPAAPSPFVSFPDPQNASFRKKRETFSRFPEEAAAAGRSRFPILLQGLAAVPGAGRATAWSGRTGALGAAPQGLALVGRVSHSSVARGGWQCHRLLMANVPMGWLVAASCHPWAPWKHWAT